MCPTLWPRAHVRRAKRLLHLRCDQHARLRLQWLLSRLLEPARTTGFATAPTSTAELAQAAEPTDGARGGSGRHHGQAPRCD